jgi:Outer membrane protein beta-barrel family
MQKIFLFSVLLSISFFVNAQSGWVKGRLIDSVGKQSLKDASITILDAKDSTLEVFGIAKGDGSFELKGINYGNLILQVSFSGYAAINKNFVLNKEKPSFDFGDLYMQIRAKDLDEVVVTQSPIVIKNDTIEYNAGSFKTKPNAVVEDLLKKLPGIEVAKDGSIKAQGETVQRVLVDGKRFFGDDPKMATKNLPPDMVDKIQVFDAQSDQSAFTGFDDGNRTKTINITTKKDRRKGTFGRAMAGGGDQGRFESSLNLNLMNGNQQFSVIGQANNVNRQSFGVQDILGAVSSGGGNRGGGGNAQMMSNLSGFGGGNSNNGITTTVAGGLNYKDVWSKKTEAYGSYFYNNLSIDRVENSTTERFIPSGINIFANQITNGKNNNQNHRFNFNIEHQFDSANSLIIRPNISLQNSDNESIAQTLTTQGKITNTNSINQTNSNSNNGYNGSVEATFRHKFKKRGRTYTINLTAGGNVNEGEGSLLSLNQFFMPTAFTKVVDQIFNTENNGNNISATLSYTEPIAKNQLLEFSVNHSNRFSNSNRFTFSKNNSTNLYDVAVDSLSNTFENINSSNRFTLSYRMQQQKYNFGLTSGLQITDLKSDNTAKGTKFNQRFYNLFPAANFTYNFSKTQNLRVNYNGRTNQPSVTQLQPVPNVTNQTNIITGNPNLVQEFNHSLRMFYTQFDIFKGRNLFALLSANYSANKIVSDIIQEANGNQKTTYTNLNGVYSINGYFNYGFSLKKPKSNLNFTTNFNFDRTANIINKQTNITSNTTLGETVSWTMNLKEKLDLVFSATSTYNIVEYSVQKQNNSNFFSQIFNVEPTYTFKGGWVVGSDFSYTYNTGRADGFNQSIPLWNASVSKLLFKKQNGELKFSIYDLLNQNISITRDVTNNFVRDVQTNVLQRYFSITFTYNLRKFGGQQQQIPSMFRGMMRGGNINNMRRSMF